MFDSSLGGEIKDRPRKHFSWVEETIGDLLKKSMYEQNSIFLKFHPLSSKSQIEVKLIDEFKSNISRKYKDINFVEDIPLIDCVDKYDEIFTFSSGSIIEAVKNGVHPSVSSSYSMGYKYCNKIIGNYLYFDQLKFLKYLSNFEYSFDEFKKDIPSEFFYNLFMKLGVKNAKMRNNFFK